MKIQTHLLIVSLILSMASMYGQSSSDTDLIAKIKLNSSKFPEWDHGASLREKVQRTGTDVTIKPVMKETSILCGQCPPPDPFNHPEVKRATSSSDIVVIGHVIRNMSSLTQNDTFVFSDSELIVDDVWKNSRSGAVAAGNEITVATPGGTVTYNGHRIRAYPSNKIPLLVAHQYLLYLKYLPDTKSYIQTGLDGFDISGQAVVPLRTTLISPTKELLTDRGLFLKAMHSSVTLAVEEEK